MYINIFVYIYIYTYVYIYIDITYGYHLSILNHYYNNLPRLKWDIQSRFSAAWPGARTQGIVEILTVFQSLHILTTFHPKNLRDLTGFNGM